MKQFLLVVALCYISTTPMFAQENDARYVIGLESNYIPIVHNENYILSSNGLKFEIPKGRWSWSSSLLRQTLTKEHFSLVNEERGLANIRSHSSKSEMIQTTYGMDSYSLIPTYAKIVNRAKYRLSCNCVHLFIGFAADILVKEEETFIRSYTRKGSIPLDLQKPELSKISHSIEMGFGTKFHFTNQLRFLFQPTYVVELSERNTTQSSVYEETFNYMKFTLGLEYGIP